MQARFNSAGTHLHNALKIGVNLYPDEGSRLFTFHYVPYFDRLPTEEESVNPAKLALIPTHKELNPCLCCFLTVPEVFTQDDLAGYIQSVFDKDTVATIGNILLLPDSIHRVSLLMRHRCKFSDKKVSSKDAVDLISSINDRFKDFVVPLDNNGKAHFVEPQSILVGADPTVDRASYTTIGSVYFGLDNPSNGTGIIDTVQVFLVTGYSATSSQLGTVYGTNPYTSRDYESGGAIAAGSVQTVTPLDIDIQTGDYIGIKAGGASTPRIELDTSGGLGGRESSSTTFPFTDVTFTVRSGRIISLQGTGTEGGLFYQNVGGSLTIASTLGRLTAKSIGNASISIASTVNLLTMKAIGSGAVGLASTLGLMIAKGTGAGAIGISGALSSILIGAGIFFQSVGDGALVIASTLSLLTKKAIGGGVVSITSTLARLTKITIGSGSVGLAGTVASIFKQFKSVGSGSLTIASTLGRMMAKSTGNGAIAITSSLGRIIKLSVGNGAVAISSILTYPINRILRIFSKLFGTEYQIESSINTEYQITSTLSAGLNITSTFAEK
jgi:hypothetical protein